MTDVIHDFESKKPVTSSIVLLGIKHVGKTTLGQDFASRHRMAWMDLDDMILDRAREVHSLECSTIREVYIQLGKQRFQELETSSARYLNINQGRRMVVSTGGGIADNLPALHELANIGVPVYLYEEESVLFHRIMSRGLPPFLDAKAPDQSFHELYIRRDRIYREAASLVVDLQGRDVSDALACFNSAVYSYLVKN
ncbi:shikimate kinase [Spirochaeta dissipatitropha]